MKISVWSDYNCPYCYIADTRLKNAIKELNLENIELELHSFELDPNAPKNVQSTTLERFAIKYNISIEEAEKEIETITQMGIDEGIDFKYASTLFTNSFDAHRLYKYVLDNKGVDDAYKIHELLFKAYFVDNKKLADHNILIDLASKIGIDKEEISSFLESEKYKSDVKSDENLAYKLGIHAVPYYIFDSKFIVPGALSTEDFKNILIKTDDEKIKDKKDAQQCDSGICKL